MIQQSMSNNNIIIHWSLVSQCSVDSGEGGGSARGRGPLHSTPLATLSNDIGRYKCKVCHWTSWTCVWLHKDLINERLPNRTEQAVYPYIPVDQPGIIKYTHLCWSTLSQSQLPPPLPILSEMQIQRYRNK